VELVDAVDKIGYSGQRLKPVQKPARNVDLSAHLVVKQEGHDPTERPRFLPGIDDHVENCAIGAADQLCLASAGSTVQSAPHALIGP